MLLALLLGCPPSGDDSVTKTDDSDSLFPSCRSSTDCTDGSDCYAPGACNAGEYTDPTDACATSEECGTGLGCQLVAATCTSGEYRACMETCDTRGCADTERCDGATGTCVPWSCLEGYTCPTHTTCAVGGMGDANGCLRDTCTDDTTCGGGYCVGGACYDALGTCEWAAP